MTTTATRYEYVDHDGNARVISAIDFADAVDRAWKDELNRTGMLTLADRAAGTVEACDERSAGRC